MRIAVFGASGNIGQIVADGLVLAGHDVTRVSRSMADRGCQIDVLDDPEMHTPLPVDAILYCSWATRDRSENAQRDHAAAASVWAKAASDCGTGFVFVSTTLAASQNGSEYAKWKSAAENGVLNAGGIVAQVGLVADDAYPLTLTTLRQIYSRMPVLDRLLHLPVHAVSSKSLTTALAVILEQPVPSQSWWVASSKRICLADMAAWPRPPKKLHETWADSEVRHIRVANSGRLAYLQDALNGVRSTVAAPPVHSRILDTELMSPDWTVRLIPQPQ